MQYKLFGVYDLKLQETVCGSDGRQYLKLVDDDGKAFTVRPYTFLLDWPESQMPSFKCIVTNIVDGNPRLQLYKASILEYCFQDKIGHYAYFKIVTGGQTDPNTNAKYWMVKDVYGIEQRFYPKDITTWESYKVMDDVILEVKGIINNNPAKNNAFLDLAEHTDFKETVVEENEKKTIRNECRESIGYEGPRREFKSSIRFTSSGIDDMKTQIGVLMHTIAGFMNRDGGELCIGVNDAGEPYRDIKEDFYHLNDCENDHYHYKPNEDNYKTKIHNSVRDYLGGNYADTLVTIELATGNGITYAVVKVKKSDFPIWFNKTELYVRSDNSTRRLEGDEITKWILSQKIPVSWYDDLTDDTADTIDTNLQNTEDPGSKGTDKPEPRPAPRPQNKDVWKYMVFYKNGEWMLSDKECVDVSVECCVPIPKSHKSMGLMIAYEDGHVNTCGLKNTLYGTGKNSNKLITRGQTQATKGLSNNCGGVVNAFCVKKNDAILIECVEAGIVYVKAHSIKDISSNFSRKLDGQQGVSVIPTRLGVTLNRVALLPADSNELQTVDGMGLMALGHKKYDFNGVNKNDIQATYRETVNRILSKSDC